MKKKKKEKRKKKEKADPKGCTFLSSIFEKALNYWIASATSHIIQTV